MHSTLNVPYLSNALVSKYESLWKQYQSSGISYGSNLFFFTSPLPPLFFHRRNHLIVSKDHLSSSHPTLIPKRRNRSRSFFSENGKIISFFPFPPGSHGPHLRLMLKSKVGLRIDTASSSFRNAIISFFNFFSGNARKKISHSVLRIYPAAFFQKEQRRLKDTWPLSHTQEPTESPKQSSSSRSRGVDNNLPPSFSKAK